MLKELLNQVQDKYKRIQEEEARYQELLEKSLILPSFHPFAVTDKKSLTLSYRTLMDLCPDLNEKDAILIRGLIPIEELCLSCLYAMECKTGVKFYFVATTKYLWLIHANGYLKYPYQDFPIELVKSGLMSKILWIENMLFNVNGMNDIIEQFMKLLQDANYRNSWIQRKLEIFCDTIPSIFYMNDIGSGISIGKKQEIVFHTKDFHYKYLIHDIKNYELLLDDMVVREKRSNRRARITANKNSCYQMVLRVTTNDQVFLLPILEKTTFMTLYSSTSEIFRDNKAFVDKLVDLLDELDEKMLNGELSL